MKNDCSVVRDILPLYIENMVSDETAAFVREHLESCPECASELEGMKDKPETKELESAARNELDGESAKSLKSLRKKLRKKSYRAGTVIAAVFIAICLLLYFFPVYRIVNVGSMFMENYYSPDQVAMALYIGSFSDRVQAQAVLRLADKAFSDTTHTSEENEETYGLLSRYATGTDIYSDAAFNTHSLQLWSAHLGDREGWIWVYYSSETFNHDGSTARGSRRVASLWKVEKSDTGEWVVVQIREHP
jgi:hypothetical protein